MVNDAPIGIFDSGVGGLTVARAIQEQMPDESIHYIGDTARCPYGPQPIADVREFALEIVDDLVEQGAKIIVIACNTASAAMLRDARERYAVPVVEVIQPAVRAAVRASRSGRIGVIGTIGTINSGAYQDAFAAAPELQVLTRACPRFVEFVEAGITTGADVLAVAEEYLGPLRDAGVDTLVLGCTHYPFLRGVISYVMGPDVTLVSSDTETAHDVYRALVGTGTERRSTTPPRHRYEATGESIDDFVALARRLITRDIPAVSRAHTGTIDLPGGLAAATARKGSLS